MDGDRIKRLTLFYDLHTVLRQLGVAASVPTPSGILISPRRASMQDPSTPVAGFVVSEPAACTVEPRPVDDLIALLATPPSGPPDLPTPVVVPSGEPADAATVAAVTATTREIVACVHAGDFLRAYALFTDDALRETLSGFQTGAPLTREQLAGFFDGPPEPIPGNPPEVRVLEARVLPDGRVLAVIEVRHAEGVTTQPLLFVRGDNRVFMEASLATITPLLTEGQLG